MTSAQPAMPRGSSPGERRGGREAGTPNKMTKQLKAMILSALDDAGGQDLIASGSRAIIPMQQGYRRAEGNLRSSLKRLSEVYY